MVKGRVLITAIFVEPEATSQTAKLMDKEGESLLMQVFKIKNYDYGIERQTSHQRHLPSIYLDIQEDIS